MSAPSRSKNTDHEDRFCSHCLCTGTLDQEVCEGCGVEFCGAGSFDLLEGPGPSSIFLAVFGKLAHA